MTVKEQVLDYIRGEGGAITNDESNADFFRLLSSAAAEDTKHPLRPETVGQEIVNLENDGRLIVNRLDGRGTPIVSIALPPSITVTEEPDHHHETVPSRALALIEPEHELDGQEANYLKTLLVKVAELNIYTLIDAVRQVG